MMTKRERYAQLLARVASLLDGETDAVANLANVSSLIHEMLGCWWTGFYRVCGGQLVLGPFQGPVACTRIPFGKGVCGTSWQRGETIVVPDVEEFPGHIACSSASRSEIVVPVRRDGEIVAVLDIDSRDLAAFDAEDAAGLEAVAALLGGCF